MHKLVSAVVMFSSRFHTSAVFPRQWFLHRSVSYFRRPLQTPALATGPA